MGDWQLSIKTTGLGGGSFETLTAVKVAVLILSESFSSRHVMGIVEGLNESLLF